MRRRPALLALAVVGTVTVLAQAVAPPNQYQVFNKADTVIHDVQTGLYWLRQPAPKDYFGPTQTYCSGKGYRLPTYKELLSLVDEDPHYEYDADAGADTLRYIDPNAFPGTPPDVFWSLSPTPNGSRRKVVSFGDGTTADRVPSTDQAYTFCVR